MVEENSMKNKIQTIRGKAEGVHQRILALAGNSQTYRNGSYMEKC